MAPCPTCNDLALYGLPERPPSWSRIHNPQLHHPDKAFEISSKIKDAKSTAQQGCQTCFLVLQSIMAHAEAAGQSLLSTDRWDEANVQLRGDCNEPLQVLLDGVAPYIRDEFELFEGPGESEEEPSLYPAIGYGHTPPLTLDLAYAARISKQWMKTCDSEHHCCQMSDTFMPTRLIDIGGEEIKLVITQPHDHGRYVALSYCWGTSGNATTTSINLNDRRKSIPLCSLPNLIRDVIQFTRLLGVRYLWIDALCIVQDDKDDWRTESSRMGDVYAGAYVTVATASAADTTQSLTRPRNAKLRSKYDTDRPGRSSDAVDKSHEVRALPRTVVNKRTHTFYARTPYWHKDILLNSSIHSVTYPLNTRGWTMQERLLSSRIVHFGAHEMIWECKKSLFCECGGIFQDESLRVGHETPKVAFEKALSSLSARNISNQSVDAEPGYQGIRDAEFAAAWMNMVSMFSVRELTYETDKLPAVSALARRFSKDKTYLAGLWLQDLPWYLVWTPGIAQPKPFKTAKYAAPSWSWVAIAGKIFWSDWTKKAKSAVIVEETSTSPLRFNAYGEVTGGLIRLRGRAARATLRKTNWGKAYLANSRGTTMDFKADVETGDQYFRKGERVTSADQRDARTMHDGEDVWCLAMFDDMVEHGGEKARRCHWLMVAARASVTSIQRSLECHTLSSHSLVCERIGYMESQYGGKPSTEMSRWIEESDFEEREMVLV